jgi:hypothetical protein
MFSFAVLFAATTAERFRQIPSEFWLRAAAAVAVLVAVVVLLRKVARMNKLLLIGGVLFVASIIGFNWIYERNEPAWATPAVQWLAGFFPSKAKVNSR